MNQNKYSRTPHNLFLNKSKYNEFIPDDDKYHDKTFVYSPKITQNLQDKISQAEKKKLYKKMLDQQIYQNSKFKNYHKKPIHQQLKTPQHNYPPKIYNQNKFFNPSQLSFTPPKIIIPPPQNYDLIRDNIKNQLNSIKIPNDGDYQQKKGNSKFFYEDKQKKRSEYFEKVREDGVVEKNLQECQRILNNIKNIGFRKNQYGEKKVSYREKKQSIQKYQYKNQDKQDKRQFKHKKQQKYSQIQQKNDRQGQKQIEIKQQKQQNKEIKARIKSQSISSARKFLMLPKNNKNNRFTTQLQQKGKQQQYIVQKLPHIKKVSFEFKKKPNKQILNKIQKLDNITIGPHIKSVQQIKQKIQIKEDLQNKKIKEDMDKNEIRKQEQINDIQKFFKDKNNKSNLQQTKERIKLLTANMKNNGDQKNVMSHLIRAKARGYKLFEKVKKYKTKIDNRC